MWKLYRAVLLFPLTVAYTVYAVQNCRCVFNRVMREDTMDRLVALTTQFFDELPRSGCADLPCRDDGCPFDLADNAPVDCARTIEARRWTELATSETTGR